MLEVAAVASHCSPHESPQNVKLCIKMMWQPLKSIEIPPSSKTIIQKHSRQVGWCRGRSPRPWQGIEPAGLQRSLHTQTIWGFCKSKYPTHTELQGQSLKAGRRLNWLQAEGGWEGKEGQGRLGSQGAAEQTHLGHGRAASAVLGGQLHPGPLVGHVHVRLGTTGIVCKNTKTLLWAPPALQFLRNSRQHTKWNNLSKQHLHVPVISQFLLTWNLKSSHLNSCTTHPRIPTSTLVQSLFEGLLWGFLSTENVRALQRGNSW